MIKFERLRVSLKQHLLILWILDNDSFHFKQFGLELSVNNLHSPILSFAIIAICHL